MNDLISRKSILRHFIDWQQQNASVGKEREYNILEMAIKGIKNEPSVIDWIPCTERLPNKYCHCLVTRKNYYQDGFDTDIQEDVYIELEGEWGWQSNFEGLFGEIIAWMPLPEPYNPAEN